MNTLRLTDSQSKNINLLKGLSILFVVLIHADLRSIISVYMDVSVPVDIYGNLDKNTCGQRCPDVFLYQWLSFLFAKRHVCE